VIQETHILTFHDNIILLKTIKIHMPPTWRRVTTMTSLHLMYSLAGVCRILIGTHTHTHREREREREEVWFSKAPIK